MSVLLPFFYLTSSFVDEYEWLLIVSKGQNANSHFGHKLCFYM